jgi:hypothetical protein
MGRLDQLVVEILVVSAVVLVRQFEDVGFEEDIREAVNSLPEPAADASFAPVQQQRRFSKGVFLEHDAADDYAIECGEPVEALLHIKDKNDVVFEGRDRAMGGPTALQGLLEDGGVRPTSMEM